MASRPLTHQPFANVFVSKTDKQLKELGYGPVPSIPKQKKGDRRDKKPSKQSPASPSKTGEPVPTARPSRASSTKKKATTRSGGGGSSSLQELGEKTLDVAVEDVARPYVRGAAYAAGAVTGAVVAGNVLSKTGMKVPGFQG